MAKSETETRISLKLLVDKSSNKVLFAEAGKEFVDFIFHMMSLPLGAVVKLLNQNDMVESSGCLGDLYKSVVKFLNPDDMVGSPGCLGDLYRSVESLDTQYFQSIRRKESVLNPKIVAVDVPLLSLTGASSAPPGCYLYNCKVCHPYVTDFRGTACPSCGRGMNKEMKYVDPTASGNEATPSSSGGCKGYVKGLLSYMVMDNLQVKPMSPISGVTLTNQFCIKDLASLAEMEIQVGRNEGLEILRASLETKAVLTSVFLSRPPPFVAVGVPCNFSGKKL